MQTCSLLSDGATAELRSPSFVFTLNTSSGLRAESWTNLLTGTKLNLGRGLDLDFDLDAADRRIWISGWRGAFADEQADFARPEFDDSAWTGMSATAPEYAHMWDPNIDKRTYRTRTHVFLPPDAEGKDMSLTLGGFGLYDYREMRVFVNGHEVGVRREDKRWHEPGNFDLGPGSAIYERLRFGQDNIIAAEMSGYTTRTARMDELDPDRGRSACMKVFWPAQCEQYLTVGRPLLTPKLRVVEVIDNCRADSGEVTFRVEGEAEPVSATVIYRWDESEPVFRKFVEITNGTSREIRLMNVRLGSYATGAAVSEGEQGFPVYIDGEFFASLAHPSGWAIGQDGQVILRQYPGKLLAPGDAHECMEAVLGVSESGAARDAFLAHVKSRCRRVARGHDKPYALFEPFGGQSGPQVFGETEEFVLDSIAKVAEGERQTGCHFDSYTLEFWVDYKGDLVRAEPNRFPNQLEPIRNELAKLGTSLGLWIDSSCAFWTIGENPIAHSTLTHDTAYGPDRDALCRATEPVKTMYSTAFRHHIRENGVRLIKFDNIQAMCCNPNHDHLPGVYSTEAIQSAVIETLRDLDRECPDVFLMLYWGHRSPWWLFHGDTLFEPGFQIEAAHPTSSPTLFTRDSVIVGLDQAHLWCEDVPRIGKDSLGVWLSGWQWNSGMGKERWQEAFVMDICRGSLLAQPWSDFEWLSTPEREQIAEFIALLRARPDCFGNSKFILGDPWKYEPYGYCCSNGSRAFVALNNCTWSDQSLPLAMNASLGLRDGGDWDIYRWYPDPARLISEQASPSIALRPFEVVLLEVVPAGESPSLDREFKAQPMPTSFAEPSTRLEILAAIADGVEPRSVPVESDERAGEDPLPPKRVYSIKGRVPASTGGTLAVSMELFKESAAHVLVNVGRFFSIQGELGGQPARCTPANGHDTYPVSWQLWRIPVAPSDRETDFELYATVMVEQAVEIRCSAWFVP